MKQFLPINFSLETLENDTIFDSVCVANCKQVAAATLTSKTESFKLISFDLYMNI